MGKATFTGLPEQCFYKHNVTGETILIVRGEEGFFPQSDLKHRDPEELNEILGVNKGQATAMYKGSMYGWDVPASNPASYDEDGNIKKE